MQRQEGSRDSFPFKYASRFFLFAHAPLCDFPPIHMFVCNILTHLRALCAVPCCVELIAPVRLAVTPALALSLFPRTNLTRIPIHTSRPEVLCLIHRGGTPLSAVRS